MSTICSNCTRPIHPVTLRDEHGSTRCDVSDPAGRKHASSTPWRVTLHTADGWLLVGHYATYRGARQALRHAERKHGTTPQCSRSGGTDSTYSVASNMDRNEHDWYPIGKLQGCQVPPDYHLARDYSGHVRGYR